MKVKNEQKLKNQSETFFRPNLFLKIWLGIHMVAIVIAIFGLSGLAIAGLFFIGLYAVDACIQFFCVKELWKGNLSGYRGLMILFVLRVVSLFFVLSWLNADAFFQGILGIIFPFVVLGNGFDAFLLALAVYQSKSPTLFPVDKKKKYPDFTDVIVD